MIFFQNNADKYQIKKTYLPNLKLSHCWYLDFNETKKTQAVRHVRLCACRTDDNDGSVNPMPDVSDAVVCVFTYHN